MGTLKEKAQRILAEKNAKIVSNNIKKNVQIFDVTGTLDNIDTSDATALETDIAEDKTAYVNGQKVLGTLKDYRGACGTNFGSSEVVEKDDENNRLMLNSYISDSSAILDNEVQIPNYLSYSEITDEIGLTPDKIKLGEKVLGINGTCAGGGVIYELSYNTHSIVVDFTALASALRYYIDEILPGSFAVEPNLNGDNCAVSIKGSGADSYIFKLADIAPSGNYSTYFYESFYGMGIDLEGETTDLLLCRYDKSTVASGKETISMAGHFDADSSNPNYDATGRFTLNKLYTLINSLGVKSVAINDVVSIYNYFEHITLEFISINDGITRWASITPESPVVSIVKI